jgi:hypothetical protein
MESVGFGLHQHHSVQDVARLEDFRTRCAPHRSMCGAVRGHGQVIGNLFRLKGGDPCVGRVSMNWVAWPTQGHNGTSEREQRCGT